MIIGLTGKNGSGKTQVCEYLKARGFQYHSLSDAIREEILRRGQEISREVLIAVGNDLREKFGPGILAERILPGLERDQNYVIDSIRNPSEVEVMKRRKDFVLVAVDADQQVRFERSLNRGRERAARTLAQFVDEEERELESENPAGQQLPTPGVRGIQCREYAPHPGLFWPLRHGG